MPAVISFLIAVILFAANALDDTPSATIVEWAWVALAAGGLFLALSLSPSWPWRRP